MQLIRALPFFAILGFTYGSTLLPMPEFPIECVVSEPNCWALMLKPNFDECPQNVIGMPMSTFFLGTSKVLCKNEKLKLCSYCKTSDTAKDYQLVKGCEIYLHDCWNQNWLQDFKNSQCICNQSAVAMENDGTSSLSTTLSTTTTTNIPMTKKHQGQDEQHHGQAEQHHGQNVQHHGQAGKQHHGLMKKQHSAKAGKKHDKSHGATSNVHCKAC